jgi:hypothetical protein
LYSTLKRKTPLRAKAPLRAKKGLNTYKPLRAGASTASKPKKSGEKKQRQAAYKPVYPYASIFTADLKTCYITGSNKDSADIHVHHIFGGANKANSEKYHFLIPLRADWHDMADYGIHFNRELDLKIKRFCQDYWLEHYGTKEEFIVTFSKWW